MSKLTHLKELFSHVSNANLEGKMAPGFCSHLVPYCKLLLGNSNDNELAGTPSRALTKSNSSFLTFLSSSCIFTLGAALASTSSTLVHRYINKYLQRAIKFIPELFL